MKSIFIFVISLLVGPVYSLKAQSLDTLTISPIVGNVIDSAEKMQYHLFPYFSMDQFIQAVFIINADSTITLKAQLKPDSVVERPMTKQEYDWILTMIESDHSTVKSHAPNPNSVIYGNDRKWSFSVFAGFSPGGIGKEIENKMVESGFGHSGPGGYNWFTGSYYSGTEYPIRKTGMVWNFGIKYNRSAKSALDVTIGKINHSFVQGYDGNYLAIKSDLWSAAFNYVWRIGSGNNGFNLGPVIALHKISESGFSSPSEATSSTITAGFNLGCTLAFIQKKSWFLAIKANFTWLPDAKIGPYTIQQTSVFEETKISKSTINIGVATGWRF